MAILSSATRSALPASKFAGPGRSYPITDRGHAIAAESDASRAARIGNISAGQKAHIDAMAKALLKK